jgi:death-on-curing protein
VSRWRWVGEAVVVAVHDEQLAEHGGATGVRDLALLQSALARPKNLAAYGSPDIADLAAAYAYGITKNHPFIDGNKRTALLVANIFLLDHGHDIGADDADLLAVMLRVSDGAMKEKQFAEWLRRNIVRA